MNKWIEPYDVIVFDANKIKLKLFSTRGLTQPQNRMPKIDKSYLLAEVLAY